MLNAFPTSWKLAHLILKPALFKSSGGRLLPLFSDRVATCYGMLLAPAVNVQYPLSAVSRNVYQTTVYPRARTTGNSSTNHFFTVPLGVFQQVCYYVNNTRCTEINKLYHICKPQTTQRNTKCVSACVCVCVCVIRGSTNYCPFPTHQIPNT